jgi:Flp pilus assembly protein TadG
MLRMRALWMRVDCFRAERGQSLIELALTLPIMLLLVLATVDIGMGFRTYIGLSTAAREGVRWISIHPNDPAGALARVSAEAGRMGLLPGEGSYTVDISPSYPRYRAGQEVTVTINYRHQLLFGSLTRIPEVPFTARATMVVLYEPVLP